MGSEYHSAWPRPRVGCLRAEIEFLACASGLDDRKTRDFPEGRSDLRIESPVPEPVPIILDQLCVRLVILDFQLDQWHLNQFRSTTNGFAEKAGIVASLIHGRNQADDHYRGRPNARCGVFFRASGLKRQPQVCRQVVVVAHQPPQHHARKRPANQPQRGQNAALLAQRQSRFHDQVISGRCSRRQDRHSSLCHGDAFVWISHSSTFSASLRSRTTSKKLTIGDSGSGAIAVPDPFRELRGPSVSCHGHTLSNHGATSTFHGQDTRGNADSQQISANHSNRCLS